jgi:vacuolar-type H+-ATPase subunit I/STV1
MVSVAAAFSRGIGGELSMAKKSSKKSKNRGGGVRDLVEGGQQLIWGAQGRAEDAAKRLQKTMQETVASAEKRYNVELKNLQGRLRDLNTSMGGLERSYRAMEKRVTKQIETVSGRAVRASDLDNRIRTLEAEILRATGLGPSPARTARRAATGAKRARKRTRAASTARRSTSTSRRSATARTTAARKLAAAKKPAARKTAARKPAARKTAARKPAARKTAASKPSARRRTSARRAPARPAAAATTTPTTGGSAS